VSAKPLAPYPPPEDREARLEQAALTAGAELATIGVSVEGRSIRAARIPGGSAKVLLVANIHGPEWIGAIEALAFLERANTALLAPLRARAEIWVLPCLNPDGYAKTFEAQGDGTLAELRTNARGVDLNRNFPRPKAERPPIAFAGSDRPGTAFYRGTQPLSEPEASALDGFLFAHRFQASLSLHSTAGVLIPPKVLKAEDDRRYRALCSAFSAAQPAHRYRRIAQRHLDVFTGELEDHQHHAHRCWSLCVEIFPLWTRPGRLLFAPNLFWRFNPKDPEVWADNDHPGFVAYYLAALDAPPPA
jgi:predicted deacylase